MDNCESTHKLSKHSENFHKFNKYDLYSIPIVFCVLQWSLSINFMSQIA